MAKKVSHIVFRIVYSYTDYELNERVEHIDYVQDFSSLTRSIKEIEEENIMVAAGDWQCRKDIEIKIKQVYITDRKFVQLFNM